MAEKKVQREKDEKILEAMRNEDGYIQDRGIELKKTDEENEKRRIMPSAFSRLPAIVRAMLVKFWFAGAAFFFVGFGIVSRSYDNLDITAAIGLLIGILTDLIVTPFLNMCDGEKRDAYKFNVFNFSKKHKVLSVVCNLLYGLLITFAVILTFAGINIAINNAKGLAKDTVTFASEPLLCALFFVIYDIFVLYSKMLIIKITKILRSKNKENV